MYHKGKVLLILILSLTCSSACQSSTLSTTCSMQLTAAPSYRQATWKRLLWAGALSCMSWNDAGIADAANVTDATSYRSFFSLWSPNATGAPIVAPTTNQNFGTGNFSLCGNMTGQAHKEDDFLGLCELDDPDDERIAGIVGLLVGGMLLGGAINCLIFHEKFGHGLQNSARFQYVCKKLDPCCSCLCCVSLSTCCIALYTCCRHCKTTHCTGLIARCMDRCKARNSTTLRPSAKARAQYQLAAPSIQSPPVALELDSLGLNIETAKTELGEPSQI